MPAPSLLASLMLSSFLFSTSALHVPFTSVTTSSPLETIIQHPSVLPNTTLTLPFPWRIPNTSIGLQLRLGRPVHPDVLLQLLLLVEDEVRDEILLYGGDTPLPKEGYDCDYDELDFSAYSPLEPGHPNTMTWGLLSTIIKGLSIYLHDQLRNREAFFKVLNGPENVFVGFGHLILGRDGVAVG